MPLDPSRIEQLFHEAIALPPAQHAAFLDSKCEDDPALRKRLEALLAAYTTDETALPLPMPAGAEGPGERIDRYKILEQIGEGGFGVVYMAEQETPVTRKVALKIIKLGMDTQQVIARFEAERQALAMMDHPGIAKVLDGGSTKTGRPYFVMELVKGIPVTQYCDKNKLDIPARLRLFMQVCSAVQHAHQKGLIHRDIKPSNVLVATVDDQPLAKVIDFGIAKAMAARLTEKTLFTAFRQLVGTPEYMSPEQADGGLDMDTRSDVYSLGVLLYELLAGSTPLEARELRSKAFAEMQRIIREVEPQLPSTRLTSHKDTLPTVAAQRNIEPAKLQALLRGELDWIVMRCIEKDRKRRYQTANSLAEDIQCYLTDQPVQARPTTRIYKLNKFIRRHKAGVIAGVAVAAALLIGVTLASIGFFQARRQARIAADKADIASRVTDELQQMLNQANPSFSRGPDYKVRELLDDFGDHLDERLADQPEVAAQLHTTVGQAYEMLQESQKASRHLVRALEIERSTYGEQHEKYADALVACATNINELPSHAVLDESETQVRQALAIYQKRGITGKRIISGLCALQQVLDTAHKWGTIEALVNEAHAEARKTPDVEYPDLTLMNYGLVNELRSQGRFDEAERIARETVANSIRLYGPESQKAAWAYTMLGGVLRAQHKHREAMETAQTTLAIVRKLVSPDHQWIGYSLANIDLALVNASFSHALRQLTSSPDELAKMESPFREIASGTPRALQNYFDPVNTSTRAIARFPDHYLKLGEELSAAGNLPEADVCHQRALRLFDELQAEFASNPDGLAFLYIYSAELLAPQGQAPRAAVLRQKLAASKPTNSVACNMAAAVLATDLDASRRDPALAVELAKRAVSIEPDDAGKWSTLGVSEYRAGAFKQAIADLDKCIQLRGNPIGAAFPFDSFALAMAHWQVGDHAEARKWYDDGVQRMDAHPPRNAVQWLDENAARDEVLDRFRAEAAALLGIAGQMPSTNPASRP